MTTPEDVAKRFYASLASTDAHALSDLLTDDFVGTVSAGMPHGVGGRHDGPTAMLSEVWGPIGAIYDLHVDPEQFLVVDDTRIVVLGRYWGPAHDGSAAVDAAFAHVITTREGRIAALQQITDTAKWALPSTRAS